MGYRDITFQGASALSFPRALKHPGERERQKEMLKQERDLNESIRSESGTR